MDPSRGNAQRPEIGLHAGDHVDHLHRRNADESLGVSHAARILSSDRPAREAQAAGVPVIASRATPEEIEQSYQQMLLEMRSDNFYALWYYLTAWGQKPR